MNLEGIFLGKICHQLPGFKQRPSGYIFKALIASRMTTLHQQKAIHQPGSKATSIKRKMPLDLNVIHVAPVENSMRSQKTISLHSFLTTLLKENLTV